MATTTSTIGMYSKGNTMEEIAQRGVRRSRFSFHFMTHRTRRWLLVQWVSVPVIANEDEKATARTRTTSEKEKRGNFQSLVSDFTTQSWLRRCA